MTQHPLLPAEAPSPSPTQAAALPVATSALLTTLRLWADQGWLRRLDSALAALLAELEPEASPTLLVSRHGAPSRARIDSSRNRPQ